MFFGKAEAGFFFLLRRFCLYFHLVFALRWGGGVGLFLGLIIAPTAGIDRGLTIALHRHSGCGHAVKEIAVMADQKDRAVVIVQEFLQQIKRFDVQIVGRFVQHQKIAFPRHQFGEQQARLFPTRKGAHRCACLGVFKQKFLQIPHHMFGRAPHEHLIRFA